MSGDLNVVILTGQITTDPIKSRMNHNKTPLTSFTLQSNENFIDSSTGKECFHPNIIMVQTMGKNAEMVADRYRKGHKVFVSGYLRSDGETTSVRTHTLSHENSFYSERYYQGIDHALDILRSSKDKTSAVEALQQVLIGRLSET